MPYKDKKKQLEYAKEYNRKHYQKNKQYYKDKARRWEEENPERLKFLNHIYKTQKYYNRRAAGLCVQCGDKIEMDEILMEGEMRVRCSVCRTKRVLWKRGL